VAWTLHLNRKQEKKGENIWQ